MKRASAIEPRNARARPHLLIHDAHHYKQGKRNGNSRVNELADRAGFRLALMEHRMEAEERFTSRMEAEERFTQKPTTL